MDRGEPMTFSQAVMADAGIAGEPWIEVELRVRPERNPDLGLAEELSMRCTMVSNRSHSLNVPHATVLDGRELDQTEAWAVHEALMGVQAIRGRLRQMARDGALPVTKSRGT